MGEGLEQYIQNIFASTYNISNELERIEKLSEIFSYQGNSHNPPDLILKNSDAIEIKKIQSKNSSIALNSSYPKAKLYSDSPMITNACKTCEVWSEKDMLYVIGHTQKKALKSLWLVYGDCFCAEKSTYERIKDTISQGVNTIPDVEFTESNEIGRVKKVDPLRITDLRIRGMWNIANPNKIFSYIYEYDENAIFQCIALLQKEKYDALPNEDRQAIETLIGDKITIKDVRIKNPDNPIQLMDAKLITYKVES